MKTSNSFVRQRKKKNLIRYQSKKQHSYRFWVPPIEKEVALRSIRCTDNFDHFAVSVSIRARLISVWFQRYVQMISLWGYIRCPAARIANREGYKSERAISNVIVVIKVRLIVEKNHRIVVSILTPSYDQCTRSDTSCNYS